MIDASLGATAGMLNNVYQSEERKQIENRAMLNNQLNLFYEEEKRKKLQEPINNAIRNNVNEDGNLERGNFMRDIAQNSPESYLGLNSSFQSLDNETNKANAAAASNRADAIKKTQEAFEKQTEQLKKQFDFEKSAITAVTDQLYNAKSDEEKNQIIENSEKQYGVKIPAQIKNSSVFSNDYKNIVSSVGNGILNANEDARKQVETAEKIYNDYKNSETNRMNAETAQINAKNSLAKTNLDILKDDRANSKDLTNILLDGVKNQQEFSNKKLELQKTLTEYKDEQRESISNADRAEKLINNIEEALKPFNGDRNEMLKNVMTYTKDPKYVKLKMAIEEFTSAQFLNNIKAMTGMGSLSDAEGQRINNINSRITSPEATLDTIIDGVKNFKIDKETQKTKMEDKYKEKKQMIDQAIFDAENSISQNAATIYGYTGRDIRNRNGLNSAQSLLSQDLPTSLPTGNQTNLAPPAPPQYGAAQALMR